MGTSHAWIECRVTGKRVPLEEFAVVGRGVNVRARIEDAGVSREHASLRRKDGEWWVQDMGSANGTFVNGLPATVSTRLRNGDELSFGPARYVFHDPGSSGPQASDDPMTMTIVARPHAEVAEVTLLVADVMGFSELATRVPAAEISRAMSAWCDHCRTVMHDTGGHIDKFIGDCVFAWWRGGTHAVKTRALEAAALLRDEQSAPRLAGGTALRCGIGLHAGEAALSRLGPSSYTLLGADVNLTFRIESLTRKLEPLVVSRAFATGWPGDSEWTFPPLGVHEVKGWHQPVEVCGVRRTGG
jgi:adenylate cyclase